VNRLPIAVVGCGHLGRIHAQLLTQLPEAELVAVVDPIAAASEALASQLGVKALTDYRTLPDEVGAVVLAAPTSLHAEIARDLIQAGIHLLVEKPLAGTYREADSLAKLARQRGVTLSVGHVERFNPAFLAVQAHVVDPIYIEAARTGPFTFRSLDVGVVMDLMIHDLELVLALVDSPVEWVTACGGPVMTSHEDFASAQVVFANGCVARFKASRTSPTAERSMSVYGPEAHCFIDFGKRTAQLLQRHEGVRNGTLQVEHLAAAEIEAYKSRIFETLLPTTALPISDANPLRDELQDFVQSVNHGRAPRVGAPHAALAVWLAEQIVEQVQAGPQARTSAAVRRAA